MRRSCGVPMGRGAELSSLCRGWRGDNSCRWVPLEMGRKMWAEAPFLSTRWKNAAECNSERDVGSPGGEDRQGKRSQVASDLRKELGDGVELRAGGKRNGNWHRSCCAWTGCLGNRNCVDGSEQNHRWDLKGLNFLENLQHNNELYFTESEGLKWMMLPARKPQLRGLRLFFRGFRAPFCCDH